MQVQALKDRVLVSFEDMQAERVLPDGISLEHLVRHLSRPDNNCSNHNSPMPFDVTLHSLLPLLREVRHCTWRFRFKGLVSALEFGLGFRV